MIDLPEWFDPERDALLTPKALRGLTHPIRLQLLELLQQEGPATATSLARRTGQNSGVTSYHLRLLAEHGFVVEDTERGTARERWWKAVHRSTSFTFRAPEDPGDPDSVEDATYFMRLVADAAHQRVMRFIDGLSAQLDELPTVPWGTDEYPLRLTLDEVRALRGQITELVQQYRRQQGDPDPREGTVRAMFQMQLLPDDS